jgi:hypothetical protein
MSGLNRPENICRFFDALFLLRRRYLISRSIREPLKIPGGASDRLSTTVSSNRNGKKTERRDDECSRVRHSGLLISLCHCHVESKNRKSSRGKGRGNHR